jgi:hypothetical protein
MTHNGTAPASAATEGRGRGLDQLGGLIGSEDSAASPADQGNRFYGAEAIKPKRLRRTKVAVGSIRDVLKGILEESHPQTVRQVFYAATVLGAVPKVEKEYKKTIIRLLVEGREAGEIPFEWITDNSRWMRKPPSFTGIEACLSSCADNYRRDLWAEAPDYVEIWCEKDALASVLMEETEPYDVPLAVTRGYSSLSFAYSAAKSIEERGKPTFVYYFGDCDPSGVDAARDLEEKLRRYAPDAEIHFERSAVTREQVEEWNLPTRPTKTTDTRAKKFGSATSVELDAIPANKLRELVRERIERHVDQQELGILKAAETRERDRFGAWAAIHAGGRS